MDDRLTTFSSVRRGSVTVRRVATAVTVASLGLLGLVAPALSQAAVDVNGDADSRAASVYDNLVVENAEDANRHAESMPRITSLEDGTLIQRTPIDSNSYYDQSLPAFNNVYLNADNRGCTSCHGWEVLYSVNNLHSFSPSYNAVPTVQTCLTCHDERYDFVMTPVPWKDVIHSLHTRSETFDLLNGTCESCHYVDRDGSYLMWDEVKYDYLTGFTDVAAEDAIASFSWNQDEVTGRDDMWFKGTHALVEDDWTFDTGVVSEEIGAKWTVDLTGDIANPVQLTIPEMIEQFGSITEIYPFACLENGIGDPFIAQAEYTGISVQDLVDYAGLGEDVNAVIFHSDDGYGYTLSLEAVLEGKGMLAYEVNGDTLYPEQGYPLKFVCNTLSAASMSKRVNAVSFVHSDSSMNTEAPVGELGLNVPQVTVLSNPDGQIFRVGEPICLEGDAYAYNLPVTKIEVSFDHGATWASYDLQDSTATRLVWWTIEVSDACAQPGSYLMQMRATCVDADGEEHVSPLDTYYMFTVRDDVFED